MVLQKEIKEYSQQNLIPLSDDATIHSDMYAPSMKQKTCTNEHIEIICSRDMDLV